MILISQPTSSSELWGLIHDAYGEDLGLTSADEDDYVAPPPDSTSTDYLLSPQQAAPGTDLSENSSGGSYLRNRKVRLPLSIRCVFIILCRYKEHGVKN